jgi:hypothetical protein
MLVGLKNQLQAVGCSTPGVARQVQGRLIESHERLPELFGSCRRELALSVA